MEIAVIAGTPFDAALGAGLLRAKGFTGTPHPMAGSPDEQDGLQYRSPASLQTAFLDLVRDLGADGHTVAMLFCNSLSAVVDSDAVTSLALISPVTVYREIVADFQRPLVVAGNGTAVVGYERTAAQASAGHRALGVSDPALVRAIENTDDPVAAFHASNLPATLRVAGQAGLDAVVLACTHFTAVLPLVWQACDVPVIDVGTRLVELTAAVARQAPHPKDRRAA